MSLIGYGVGGLLIVDSLANNGTTGHLWQVELIIGLLFAFGGALAQLARRAN